MFGKSKKKHEHVESVAEIKARKINIGVGKFSISMTFTQLVVLIILLAVIAGAWRGGLAIKTKYFSYTKPPMTSELLQHPKNFGIK